MATPETDAGVAGSESSTTSPATFPVLPGGAHTLASLAEALGKPDEAFRRILLRNHDEESFYQWGTTAETGNILADIPRFVASSLGILAGLDPARRALVLVPPGIFAVLVDEARVLEEKRRAYQAVATAETGTREDRGAALKRVSGEGVTLRDRILSGLRNALGAARIETTRKAARDASSPDALAHGLNAVAQLIEDTLSTGDADDKAALEAFGLGLARAGELRARAAAILEASAVTAATAKRVSKRALDIQDGRVLVLVDMIYRAFRFARRSDKSLLLPELNRLSALFDTTSPSPRDAAPAGTTTGG